MAESPFRTGGTTTTTAPTTPPPTTTTAPPAGDNPFATLPAPAPAPAPAPGPGPAPAPTPTPSGPGSNPFAATNPFASAETAAAPAGPSVADVEAQEAMTAAIEELVAPLLAEEASTLGGMSEIKAVYADPDKQQDLVRLIQQLVLAMGENPPEDLTTALNQVGFKARYLVHPDLWEEANLTDWVRNAYDTVGSNPDSWTTLLGQDPATATLIKMANTLEKVTAAPVTALVRGVGGAVGEAAQGDFSNAARNLSSGVDLASASASSGLVDVADGIALGKSNWLSGQAEEFDRFAAEVLAESGFDVDEDGMMNLREMLGINPEWGGRTVGAIDTLGLAFMDAGTWTGLGAPGRALTGVNILRSTVDDITAAAVMRNGLDVLTPTQRVAYDLAVREAMDTAVAASRRNLTELVRTMGPRTPEALTRTADIRTANILDSLQKGAGTVSVAGRSVPGSNVLRRIGSDPFEAVAHPLDDVIATGNVAAAKKIFIMDDLADEILDVTNDATRGTARVTVKIGLEDGTHAGTATWDVTGTEARLSDINIDPAHRGTGLAGDHIDDVIDTLMDSDVQRITFQADGDGASVLANPRFGAQFDDLGSNPTNRKLLEEAADHPSASPALIADIDDALTTLDARQVTPARIADEIGYEFFELNDLWQGTIKTPGKAQRMARTPARRGISALVPDAIQRRYNPRHDIAASEVTGKGTAEQIEEAGAKARGRTTTRVNDLLNRVSAFYSDAVKEVGRERLSEIVSEIQEGAAGRSARAQDRLWATVDQLQTAGHNQTAELAKLIYEIEETITDASKRAGIPASQLREEYFPRILTPDGETWLRANAGRPELARRGIPVGAVDRSTLNASAARTLLPDEPINRIDELIRTIPGFTDLPAGVKLFEEDPVLAYAMRGQVAFAGAARAEMIESLASLSVPGGKPLLIVDDVVGGATDGPAAHLASRLNYHQFNTASGRVWAPPEVVADLTRISDITYNAAEVESWHKYIASWNNTWARYATVPLLKGTAFHFRNMIGNLWNNFLAGVTDPVAYADALAVQRSANRVRNIMKTTGVDWDTAAREAGLSDLHTNVLKQAREQGVLGLDYFADLNYDDLAQFRDRSDMGAKERVGLVLTDNRMLTKSADFGTAVENNAKLAHFMSKLKAGDDVATAAHSVRKYLFDYGDLTPFERTTMRNFHRFYTWSRKNLGVQMHTLAHYPGRTAALMRMEQRFLGDEENSAMPDWMRQAGGRTGSPIGDALGLSGSTAVAFDTPWRAAVEMITPGVILLDQIPGMKDIIPGESGGTDLAVSMKEAYTSGGPQAAIDLVYNYIAGEDLRTGAPLPDGTEGKARALFDTLFPIWGAADRTVAKLTDGDGIGPIGNDPRGNEDFIAGLWNVIIGITVTEVNERDANAAVGFDAGLVKKGLIEELVHIMDLAEERGISIPGLDDLRNSGLEPVTWDKAVEFALAQNVDEEDTRERTDAQRLQMYKEAFPHLWTDAREAKLQEAIAEDVRKGVRLVEGGDATFDTRLDRMDAFALEQGIVKENGEPRRTEWVEALWNINNPDDQILNKNTGLPTTIQDVDPGWDQLSTKAEVTAYLASIGQPVTGGLNDEEIERFNSAHRNKPYIRNSKDKIDQGYMPSEGAFHYVDSDNDIDRWYYPPGMSLGALGASAEPTSGSPFGS